MVRKNSEEKELSMNVKKMKTMVESHDETPDVRIVVNGQVLEQVKKVKYLGQWITDDGRCKCEIKNRIEIARRIFRDQKTSGKVLRTFHLFVCLRITDTK